MLILHVVVSLFPFFFLFMLAFFSLFTAGGSGAPFPDVLVSTILNLIDDHSSCVCVLVFLSRFVFLSLSLSPAESKTPFLDVLVCTLFSL